MIFIRVIAVEIFECFLSHAALTTGSLFVLRSSSILRVPNRILNLKKVRNDTTFGTISNVRRSAVH